MTELKSLQQLMQERTLRYRWEKAKLDLSEWWLRVVMQRPPALQEDEDE